MVAQTGGGGGQQLCLHPGEQIMMLGAALAEDIITTDVEGAGFGRVCTSPA